MSAEGTAHFSTHPYIVRRAFILQTPESKSHSGMALAGQSWQPRRPEFETTNADILTYAIGIMAFAYTSTCMSIPTHTAQAYADKDDMATFCRGIDLPLALAS